MPFLVPEAGNKSEVHEWNDPEVTTRIAPFLSLPFTMEQRNTVPAIVTVSGACPSTDIRWEYDWISISALYNTQPMVPNHLWHFLSKWIKEVGETPIFPYTFYPNTCPPVSWDENFFWVGSNPLFYTGSGHPTDSGLLQVRAYKGSTILQGTNIGINLQESQLELALTELDRIQGYSSFDDYLDGG